MYLLYALPTISSSLKLSWLQSSMSKRSSIIISLFTRSKLIVSYKNKTLSALPFSSLACNVFKYRGGVQNHKINLANIWPVYIAVCIMFHSTQSQIWKASLLSFFLLLLFSSFLFPSPFSSLILKSFTNYLYCITSQLYTQNCQMNNWWSRKKTLKPKYSTCILF